MDVIAYSILLLISFVLYINMDKIFSIFYKNKKTINLLDEKISKRKKLGSPRKDK